MRLEKNSKKKQQKTKTNREQISRARGPNHVYYLKTPRPIKTSNSLTKVYINYIDNKRLTKMSLPKTGEKILFPKLTL